MKARNPSIEYFGIKIRCPSTTSARLLRAILFQDVREVEHVINAEGANVNNLCHCWTKDQDSPYVSYRLTPLSVAVRFSTNRVVRSLLQHGADANVKCDMTPLGVAVQRNDKKLTALLLDSGANIDLLTHPVVKRESRISDEETRDHLMQTPLHIACRKGFVTMTAYLLLKQAATDIIDGSGNTPANVARKYGHREVEVLIVREAACRTSMTAHSSTCRNEYIRIATHYEGTLTTQLIMACIHNDVKKAYCFISYGVNVNATDASLNTALHYACANGNQKLVKLLLQHHAKADAVNKEKKSPIQVAMEYGYLAVAFILIEHKCVLPHQVLFATNSGGNTLLHIACKQKRIAVVKQLLKRGAFLNVANEKGKSPTHYVWQNGNVQLRRIVVDHVFQRYQVKTVEGWQRFDDTGAQWFIRYVEMALCRMVCKVISQEWGGSLMALNGEEVHENLCSACGKLTPNACYFLLSHRVCDLSMLLASCCSRPCRANCTSLLHICCCKTKDWKTVEQLIEHGADVNAVDCRGNTPMHLACCSVSGCVASSYWCHCQSVISTLLDNGASPYIVNDSDKTALWYAFSENNSKLVRWLILEKEINVDAEVLHGFNDDDNTLLLTLATDEVGLHVGLDDELLWRLVERGARINVPARTTSDRSHNATCSKQPRLLDVLARNRKWVLIRKLVEVGCCDFTTEMFHLLYHDPGRRYTSLSNERPMCSRIQTWKWFLLAGFGQCDERGMHIDTIREFHLRKFQSEWESKYDSEVSASDEDANDGDEDQGNVNTFHPDQASCTTNAKTRMTLKWLKHDIENPPSLSRLCVYTIRHQLIYTDPYGKSIFPSIDKLPLPTRLKESLKLRDIKCYAECFDQQRNDCSVFNFSALYMYLNRCHYSIMLRRCPGPFHHCIVAKESTFEVEKEQSVEGSDRSVYRRPRKRTDCTLEKVGRRPAVSYSVRRSRTLVQPRRCH